MLRFIVLILATVYWQRADFFRVLSSVRSSSLKTLDFPSATFKDNIRGLNQSIAQHPELHIWTGKSHLSATIHSCFILDRNQFRIQFRTYTMQNSVEDTLDDVKVSSTVKTEEDDSFLAAANAMLEDAIDHMLDMAARLPSRSSAQQAAFAAQALARVDRTRLCYNQT